MSFRSALTPAFSLRLSLRVVCLAILFAICTTLGCSEKADPKARKTDSSGKELKSHNATETGAPKKPESVVLPKRSRTTLITTAFFMPDEATDVRASLRSVTFAEGETWKAGGPRTPPVTKASEKQP